MPLPEKEFQAQINKLKDFYKQREDPFAQIILESFFNNTNFGKK